MNKNILLVAAFSCFAAFGFAQIKVVAPNGDVGIGTDNPSEKLDVGGNARIQGRFLYVGQNAGSVGAGVEIGRDRTISGNAYFDMVGNLAYPDYGVRLIRRNTGVSSFTHRGTEVLEFKAMEAADMTFKTSNILRMTIQSNGTVNIAGDATVSGGVAVTSDSRLKEEVKNYKKGLDVVLKLNPVSFKYKDLYGLPTHRNFIGLLAQDIEKEASEFVENHTFTEYDFYGVEKISESFLKIHDSEIKYLLINAIKDQQDLIENQNDEISNLYTRLEKLEELLMDRDNSSKDYYYQNSESSDNIIGFQIYPNPNSSRTVTINNLDYSNSSNFKIYIANVKGEIVQTIDMDTKKVQSNSFNFNVSALNAGMYFCTIVDSSGVNSGTRTLILE